MSDSSFLQKTSSDSLVKDIQNDFTSTNISFFCFWSIFMYDSLDKDFLIGQILMAKQKIINKRERERDRQTDRGIEKERKRETNAERKKEW